MKRIIAFILVFMLALCPMYMLSISASDDFVAEDGVLLSYTGNADSVTIPDGIYYIADGAFKNNTQIKSVTFTADVIAVGNEAFYGCTALESVKNATAVSSVGAYAFYATPYLSNSSEDLVRLNTVIIGGDVSGELLLPAGVGAVAPYAFSKNTEITAFTAPDSLNEIGEGAFLGCTGLSNVNVGNSVSYIGALAFQGTAFLNNNTSDFVVLGDGILVKYSGNDTDVTIPDGIKQIGGGAFYGNSALTSVTLSDNVDTIGMRSFMNCNALKSVNMNDSLLMIDKEAFAKCTSLNVAVIPASVQLLGESVFYGCNSLTLVTYNTDASVPRGMFADCTALKAVVLNYDITGIGEYAFNNCSALSDLSISDNVISIDKSAFGGCDKLTVSCYVDSYAYTYCGENSVNALQCGDANYDGKVNIRDATHIQKYAANFITMSSVEKLRAEVNFDGKVNIRDATVIQKLVAGLV